MPRTLEILHGWQKRWEGEGTDWAATLVQSRYEAITQLAEEFVLLDNGALAIRHLPASAGSRHRWLLPG